MGVLEMFGLDGKVAIVTGASSGLGVAFAQAFAEAGADVALGARRVEKLEETAQLVRDTGRRAITVPTDVADPDQCQALVDAAMAEFGRVDVLVNNAGIAPGAPATRESPEQFRSVIDINLNGCYWMAQACGRVMEPGSSIINISSVLAITTAGLPQAAYTASKAGLLGLTRDLAQQWTGRKGIRVNALAPGFFESEMSATYPDGYLDAMQWRVLSGRMGDAAELAATAVWLASPAGGYVTGQTILVDGGVSITLTTPSSGLGDEDLVWYVAYGSNLLAGRFTCYLEGGRPPGAARTYAGCRDTSRWRTTRPVAIPGQLCFGGLSPTWGGGLAFLTHPAAGEARGRGYLVTAGQLADLARQEARVGPEHRLTLTPAGGRWHDVVPAYESVLGLGELDGHPAFTLTTAGSLAAAPPAPAYVRTILAGLVETYGGTPAEHADYLLAAPGVAAGWSGSTLTALIDP